MVRLDLGKADGKRFGLRKATKTLMDVLIFYLCTYKKGSTASWTGRQSWGAESSIMDVTVRDTGLEKKKETLWKP